MSYLVLARKWRPQTFEDIVGQEHISRTLQNAIRADRVAHAFLFTGVRGVGKTTAARVLSKALNCVEGPTPTPCNTCENCVEITQGKAVDVLEIDGASNTSVDDVREIIENVRYQPAKCRCKIYLIDEVHMLSTSAFNALLKTLEEPPAHVKFIFATTDPHKVPATIHSRCQQYDFKRIPFARITARLAEIARSDGLEVSERALYLLARESEGSMRDAQSLFDQVIAFAGQRISDTDVSAALGIADRDIISNTADALLQRAPHTALAHVSTLYGSGHDLRRFTRDLLEHFRHLAVARVIPEGAALADVPAEEQAEITRQSQLLSSADLDRAFRILLTTDAEVARVPYPKLVLEFALIKIATLPPVLPAEDVLTHLEELTRQLGDGAPSTGPTARPSRPQEPVRHARTVASNTAASPPTTAAPVAAAPPAVPSAATTQDGPKTWEGFLQFIQAKKPTLITYVQSSVPPDISGESVTLKVPPGFYYSYLAKPEHTQMVADLAREFFGRALSVQVQAQAAAAPAATPALQEQEQSPAELHATAMKHPLVRAAIDTLGGEVQEVKPHKKRGTEQP